MITKTISIINIKLRPIVHTLILLSLLKPSSWLSSSNMVRCTSREPPSSLSARFVPCKTRRNSNTGERELKYTCDVSGTQPSR